jgi:HAE1 family hydrophobic/amphiphilic exporter-1
MTAADLGYAVDSLVDGAYAGDYFIGGDKIDLTIVGDDRFAARMQDLDDLPIATPAGRLVPLRAVAEVQLASGPEQINHRERQRAITIQVMPPPAMALEDAMDRIQEQIVDPLVAEGQLEGGYQIALAGTADKLRATWLALRFNLVLALLITYLLMAALFESWIHPLVVILAVPLGSVGGFLGLWLLNRFVPQPLDVLTMLGFIILIGTVVNNPILIVHQSLIHLREGQQPAQAIPEAVRMRVRPIFMTTMTTLLGLMPLVLFPGAGSELYRGLGAVLLGGLLVSTVFTLFLIPTFFRLALETKAGIVGLFKVRGLRGPSPAPEPHPSLPGERDVGEDDRRLPDRELRDRA